MALLGGRCYSIEEGEGVQFCFGKRMLCDHLALPEARKSGWLVYDCAARALRAAALLRRTGRLTAATDSPERADAKISTRSSMPRM